MRTIAVKSNDPHPKVVREAVRVLDEGGIVAFPTETVYGLAVDARNEAARARLYALKGRRAESACAYLLADANAVETYVPSLPPPARRLADAFWPGPVTLVVPSGDGGWVGLRLPSEALPRLMAKQALRPLLQTSANRSGEPAALNAAAVAATLGDGVDLILDAGRTPGGRASTVVQCDQKRFTVLRAGAVPEAEVVRAATDLYLAACTGNICRSPLAEALLRYEMALRLECEVDDVIRYGFRFESFGTMGLTGHGASDHSVTVAEEFGVDLTRHRSRTSTESLVMSAKCIYCLARDHRELILREFPSLTADLLLLDPNDEEIPDPIGSSLRTYRRVGRMIQKSVRARIDEIVAADPRFAPRPPSSSPPSS